MGEKNSYKPSNSALTPFLHLTHEPTVNHEIYDKNHKHNISYKPYIPSRQPFPSLSNSMTDFLICLNN